MPIRHWTEKISTGETNEILLEIASVIASRISSDTEREYFTACITRGDILALCNYSPSYSRLSSSDARRIRQICAFFSKRSDLEFEGIDRRVNAVSKFVEAELKCKETNEVFRLKSRGEFFFSPRVESVLHRAQRKIAFILGDLPSLSELKLRFGPGATTSVKKKNASALMKLSTPFSCSEDLVPIVSNVLEELPQWVFSPEERDDVCLASKKVSVEIHTARLAFVPKSYKVDRAIAVEPILNQMVQLGIGDYIAQRLRRSGVDLRDQSRNQRLALQGSIDGLIATVDLSSASDTVSTGVVLDLLPYEWFDFLSLSRSSMLDCDGREIRLQKFSSMGNGYTFALESLIFYALSCACVDESDEGLVSVYGDDIIIPSYAVPLLYEVLNCCGFIPNPDKSFSDGPFRESCGKDYYRGLDIRPCYVKAALSGQSLFVLHNYFRRDLDHELADRVLSFIPKHFHRFGPDGFGDGHLITDDRSHLRPHGRKKGWSGFVFETYTMKPRRDFRVLPGDYVYPSYTAYSNLFEDVVSQRWHPLLKDEGLELGIESQPHPYDRTGRLGVTLPGAETYRLIKVYTLH